MRRLLCILLLAVNGQAAKWVTSWTASVQGPYPAGNASAQPNLHFALPNPTAHDQTFRLIVQPDVWGTQARLRLSNAFGNRPVTFDAVYTGLHWSGAAVVAGTNRPVRFGGKDSVTVAPGEWVWSDAVDVASKGPAPGSKLAVSFHIAGDSGPMTWHAKALTTSYLTAPGSGAKGQLEDESAFPFSTTSWYFLDAVDMMTPDATQTIVAYGDSITDGTASTLNGDDRWPNALSRRLHAAYGDRFSVVNAGIGGNQVLGPTEYSTEKPFSGGPSARQRLERDVLSLSGVTTVLWLEGINDFGANATAEAVEAGMKEVVERLQAKKIRVIAATVVSAVGARGAHGTPAEEERRHALNEFIRHSGTFDGVADFDQATIDPQTGGMRPEFVPDSTTGGPGDHLHPNRAGYLAMAMSVDLKLFAK
jgi:lysophospholipase L1-like esterase